MKNLTACEVSIENAVATIHLLAPGSLASGTADLHVELSQVFNELRHDDSTRVLVLTGTDDEFYVPARSEFYKSEKAFNYLVDPDGSARTLQGINRLHESLCLMEKPVVCRLNGDAVSLGASLVFASDFIVATESAQVRDTHLASRTAQGVGAGAGVVPGDGAGTLAPFFLPPTLAKEFLMLARPFSASELLERGVVNRVVDSSSLDEAVQEYVDALLAVPAASLGWSKLAINAPIAAALTSRGSMATAYEFLGFAHRAIREQHVLLNGGGSTQESD